MTNNLLIYYVQYRTSEVFDWNTEAIFLIMSEAEAYFRKQVSSSKFKFRMVRIFNETIEEILCS